MFIVKKKKKNPICQMIILSFTEHNLRVSSEYWLPAYAGWC